MNTAPTPTPKLPSLPASCIWLPKNTAVMLPGQCKNRGGCTCLDLGSSTHLHMLTRFLQKDERVSTLSIHILYSCSQRAAETAHGFKGYYEQMHKGGQVSVEKWAHLNPTPGRLTQDFIAAMRQEYKANTFLIFLSLETEVKDLPNKGIIHHCSFFSDQFDVPGHP